MDLPDPGIKLESPALQADSSPAEPPRKPQSRSGVFFFGSCLFVVFYGFNLSICPSPSSVPQVPKPPGHRQVLVLVLVGSGPQSRRGAAGICGSVAPHGGLCRPNRAVPCGPGSQVRRRGQERAAPGGERGYGRPAGMVHHVESSLRSISCRADLGNASGRDHT